jgi:hypothetical protein
MPESTHRPESEREKACDSFLVPSLLLADTKLAVCARCGRHRSEHFDHLSVVPRRRETLAERWARESDEQHEEETRR